MEFGSLVPLDLKSNGVGTPVDTGGGGIGKRGDSCRGANTGASVDAAASGGKHRVSSPESCDGCGTGSGWIAIATSASSSSSGVCKGASSLTPSEGFEWARDSPPTSVLRQPWPHRTKRWQPRRCSPAASSGRSVGGDDDDTTGDTSSGGGGGGVGMVTLRDWVRSARCSPSKEPRSASCSRRDSLASSFACALVPRDEQWDEFYTQDKREEQEGVPPMTSVGIAEDMMGVAAGRGLHKWDGECSRQEVPGGAPCVHHGPPREADSARWDAGQWAERRPAERLERDVAPAPAWRRVRSSSVALSSTCRASVHTEMISSSLSLTSSSSWALPLSHSADMPFDDSANPPRHDGRAGRSGSTDRVRHASRNEAGDIARRAGATTPTTASTKDATSDGAPGPLQGWQLGWKDAAVTGDADVHSFSSVSSPSFLTPLSSPRTAAAAVDGATCANACLETRGKAPTPSSSSCAAARELALMGEWSTASMAQVGELPPAVPRMARPSPQDTLRASARLTGGTPASWRSASLSRASFSTSYSAEWGSGRGDAAKTPSLWPEQVGYDSCGIDGSDAPTGDISGGKIYTPLSSFRAHPPPRTDDAEPFRLPSGRCCESLVQWAGQSSAEEGATGACSSRGRAVALMPPPRSGSPLSFAASPTLRPPSCAAGKPHCSAADDDSTMEDIEAELTKRTCSEHSRTPPSLAARSATSLVGLYSASLADALASQLSTEAMPSEALIWQQQQQQQLRRRRAASPSVARPDDDSADAMDQRPHADRSTEYDGGASSSPNPLWTSASSTTGVAPRERSSPSPPSLQRRNTAEQLRGSRDASFPFASHRGRSPTLRPPSVRVEGVGTPPGAGVVVEVGEPLTVSPWGDAAPFDDEPEVDTFMLERAQVVMEDADAEATHAMLARQHRRYLLANSQFARDVERHGGYVDPVALELEEEDADGNEDGVPREPLRPLALAAHAAAAHSIYSCGAVLRKARSSGITSPNRGCSTAEKRLWTPPRGPTSTLTYVHCREQEDMEESCTPESSGPKESHSLRDMSPPMRERSMAPAELRKERERAAL